MRCRQWRQSWHYDNIRCSVKRLNIIKNRLDIHKIPLQWAQKLQLQLQLQLQKALFDTNIQRQSKTCVLHSNVWRLLLRYMHTACLRATKKIIGLMTFILHTITYDQRNQTSYTDAQNLSQWRTVWIMGHEWFDVKRKYKGSGKSNSVQYKIYKPICRLYEIAGACYWAKLSR